MNEEEIWRQLAIAATGDASAIRRAYARRLKQLDVDADPEAYAALRHARDAALWLASQDAPAGPTDETPDEPRLPDAAPLPVSGPEPEPEPQAARYDEEYQALAKLLFDSGDEEPTPADEAEVAALAGHFESLTRDPRLDEVGYFADASIWFAETIARSWPRSASLAEPAARYFGWEKESEIHRQPAVDWVLQRIEAMRYADSLDALHHPLNEAWAELQRPLTGRWRRRGRVAEDEVAQLLDIVRVHYPELEQRLDPERVALWDKQKKQSVWIRTARGIFTAIFIIGLLNLPRLCATNTPIAPPQGGPPPVVTSANEPLRSEARHDIDEVLLTGFEDQLDFAELSARDPKLVEVLVKSWQAGKRDGLSFDSFRTSSYGVLIARFNQDLSKADYQTRADHLRLMLREAGELKDDDPAACADFLSARRVDREFTRSLLRERRLLIARTLLEAAAAADDVSDPSYPGFDIPGEVIRQSAQRAGIPPAEFMDAMQRFDAPPQRRCAARMGFIETVLALPKAQGLPLMQAMMGRDFEPPR